MNEPVTIFREVPDARGLVCERVRELDDQETAVGLLRHYQRPGVLTWVEPGTQAPKNVREIRRPR